MSPPIPDIPFQRQEISRLLTAAIIDENFCRRLLTDPARALAEGYRGEPFRLPQEARNRLLSIRAATLAEFAAQLPAW